MRNRPDVPKPGGPYIGHELATVKSAERKIPLFNSLQVVLLDHYCKYGFDTRQRARARPSPTEAAGQSICRCIVSRKSALLIGLGR